MMSRSVTLQGIQVPHSEPMDQIKHSACTENFNHVQNDISLGLGV